jgi:hypothetical protein
MSEESLKAFAAFREVSSQPMSRARTRCSQNAARRHRPVATGGAGSSLELSISQPLLLGRHHVQAMVEKGGAIPGQHLLQIRLHRAFALPQLLGAARFSAASRYSGATLFGSTSGCERAGAVARSAMAAMKMNGFK